MKIIIVSFILLLAGTFYSCQKEIFEDDMHTDDPRLVKIQTANIPFYEYSYTSADMVIEERSTYNFINYSYNELAQIVTVDYNSDFDLLSEDKKVLEKALNKKGLLNITDSESGGVLKYKYDNNGKLKSSHFFESSASSQEYSEFTYDDNSRIGRQTLFWDNKITGYIDYLFDRKGNLIIETLYSTTSEGIPELSTTTEYEFDDYKNPFKSIYKLLIPGINTNTNNILKETYTIHFKPGEGTDITQTSVNSYEYNNRGYPVRKNGNIDYLYE
jgi:hypothetical protein